jgi:CO/xanthine dehydrogenase Mo-binding subunit
LAAQNLLLEAQRRVDALRSLSVHSVDQPSGPALKSSTTAAVAQDPYSIPKKSVMLKKADSQHSRKTKPSKGARKAKKAAKKARKAKKKAAKKEAKRAKKSRKARRPASSESMSSSSESSPESSSDAPPPPKDDQDHQVLCSVCCKNTAHLF